MKSLEMHNVSDGPWMASAPSPMTKACVITNPQGRVVAAMVPNQADAAFIAAMRENHREMWNQLVILWNKREILALLDDDELAAFQRLMIDE